MQSTIEGQPRGALFAGAFLSLLCACASSPEPVAVDPAKVPPVGSSAVVAIPVAKDVPATAQSTPGTLVEYVKLALAYRPELEAAQREFAARTAEVRQANRRINPTLEVAVEDFGGSGALSSFDGAQTTLSIAQVMERGGKRRSRKAVAELEAALADGEARLLAVDVATRTTRAYWQALRAQGQLELAKSIEETTRGLLEAVRARASAGKVSPIEEAKYTVALASASLDRREAERGLDLARRALERSVGDGVHAHQLEGDFVQPAEVPALHVLRTRLLEGQRFEQLALEEQRSVAAIELARAAGHVDLEFMVGLRRYEATDDYAAVVGLGLPLPVFNSQQDAREAARHRRQGATSDRATRELQLLSELERGWTRVVGAHADLTALEAGVLKDSAWVSSAVEEGYRSGKFDLLDALDAQRTDFEMRARHLRALADYHLARTELENLLCQPLDR